MSTVGVTFFQRVDILLCEEPSVYVGQSEQRACTSLHGMASILTSCGLRETHSFVLHLIVFLLQKKEYLCDGVIHEQCEESVVSFNSSVLYIRV